MREGIHYGCAVFMFTVQQAWIVCIGFLVDRTDKKGEGDALSVPAALLELRLIRARSYLGPTPLTEFASRRANGARHHDHPRWWHSRCVGRLPPWPSWSALDHP